MIKDWPGIANDYDLMPEEKAAARVGQDVPEDVERAMRIALGPDSEPAMVWRAGYIDLEAKYGEALVRMTDTQALAWTMARGLG